MKIIIAITGASGVIYGRRLLEFLSNDNYETFLIVSKTAEYILANELKTTKDTLSKLADHTFEDDELESPISSGSFMIDGMIIVPCSLKTLAGIACGFSNNLILRAADVTIKQRRKLILVPRETPLSPIHLKNMLTLARLGVTILPAMPAFYHNPTSVEGLVDFIVGKILDELNIDHNLYQRWTEKLKLKL